MKKLLVIANILIGSALMAQDYESDAARMMRPDLSGTARALGVGGAFSTVGADMSCMTSNPAGIALYRSHELTFSAGALWGNSNSQYLGQSSSDNFGKGTLSQAGLVLASKKLSDYNSLSFDRGGSKLDRFVFGFGFQKLADFNRTDYFYGTNTKSSYAQALATDLSANPTNINVNNFSIPSVNAYETYVADFTDSTGSQLGSKIGLPVNQVGRITTQGSLTDINLTFGFNIANTVFVGFGAGIPYMSYRRYSSFSESNATGDSSYTSTFNYTMSGVGINGKVGVIVKPVQWMRFGASFQTPTYFHINESDYGNTQSYFGDTTGYGTENSTLYNFAYYNPLKATFGASFYLKQWGFISVDYEMNDYTHTHYSFAGADKTISDQENTLIAAKYKLASTVKAGAEFSYKTLRLRAGFAWSESPFSNGTPVSGYDGARFNYTAGIGYRGKSFFADLAYVRTQYKDYYSPYAYNSGTVQNPSIQEPGVYNNVGVNTIVATIGFKFGGESRTTTRRKVVRDKAFRSF